MPSVIHHVREGRKFNTDTTLVVVECYSCKIKYAIPHSLNESALAYPGDQNQGWKLCCPLGHTWWYTGKNIEQDLAAERRLRREQEQQLQIERRRAGRLAAERDQAKAEARGQKSRGTRFKNERDKERKRVSAGMCPVPGCRRHLQNLERHIKSQHPDYVETANTVPPPE